MEDVLGTGDYTGGVRFGTYNIRNRRNGGLKLALRGMSQADMDLGILHGKNSLMAPTPVGQMGAESSL